MTRVNIGTSGWNYAHWEKGVFYPKELKSEDYLSYYAQFFSTVEINTTFYHLPLDTSVEHWCERVPKKFIFSVKGSRFITHQKRLLDPKSSLRSFFSRCALFEKHLGPILFQLPSSFKEDSERLHEFVSFLDQKHRYVFEFRDPSWFTDKVYEILKKNKISLCFSDMKGAETPLEITSDLIYIRLHGPDGPYQGRYGKKRLMKWKKEIEKWKEKTFYVYFNNDARGNAIKDAFELKNMVESDD